MTIAIETFNCDYQSYYKILEAADSEIKITLQFNKIVSRQSRKEKIDKITQLIHSELLKFDWIIVGSIQVDLTWYLNAVERQETDKVGDIDNITKPIIDALSGKNGVFVDDSQIGGLYSCWMSKNELYSDNVLVIQIKFNNDYVLYKKNLRFIQYSGAACLPVNMDITSKKDLLVAKVLVIVRKKHRKLADKARLIGANIDRYFVCSEFDFHRTRLSGFTSSDVLTNDQLNDIFVCIGIKWSDIRNFFKR
ncbi:RusA family crossover junction endodeoxyribonuclease [Flavobacterium coralii]|uniref:RusA family crossover junction endodeoxyribonuclease n=1 Tax=Flavobacterium coralii TaxID=2838017 RepID=UPI000C3ED1AE|nr:hypothetical protein [Flavobacterium sp.]|tara:strand:+ start:20 stop:769 length:750 start_codon:yes stop_codon:yes gene_type:complete